jgi:glyoxylase-like metal-dependent hydrolase (beta-lactamase superfamily II)
LHFVAHARLAATLAAREQAYRKAFEREFGQALTPADIVYPTLVVQDRLEIDLGQRSLLLQAWPTAHTDNDLSVWDAQTGTLFTGDLLFVEHIPVLDGSLPGWLAVMDRLQGQPVTLAIPGHGAPSADWPAVLAPQRAYLSALKRQTEAALGRHLSLSQALSEASLPPDWRLAELFHRRNLTAAYAELEWAD